MYRAVRFSELCLLLGAVATTPALGQEPPTSEVRKIIATGTATTFVAPDAARVTFMVATTEGTEKSIREANASHVKRIKDGLAALPLDNALVEMHILPSSFSTIVTSPQNPAAARVPQNKKAQSIFQVIVRDKNLDKLRTTVARIAETATDLGGVAIEPDNPLKTIRLPRALAGVAEETETVPGPIIEWLAFGSGDARRAGIRRAYDDAIADAQAIAGSAKLHVLEATVTVPDETPLLRIQLRSQAGAADNALIPIRVQVRVTCRY
jgi:hypothetical protein